MIEKIDTLCLGVRDVEEAAVWYEEKLEFCPTFIGEGYCVLSPGDRSIPVTLEEKERAVPAIDNYPIFFTRNIEISHEQMMEKKIEVGPIQNDANQHFFDFYDLFGNRLQVCSYD